MNLRNILKIWALSASLPLVAQAQDCVLPIAIEVEPTFANVPIAACQTLERSLTRIAVNNGLTTDIDQARFVLTASCDVMDKQVLAGPPMQVVYNLGLTLYLVDAESQNKYSTAYFELKGVGNNEAKSFTDAFRHINVNQSDVRKLIETGKSRMTDYYNKQYKQIIAEAQHAVEVQQYELALSKLCVVPVCSQGSEEVSRIMLDIYTRYLHRVNKYILNQARALWAAEQSQDAALAVCRLLANIDPESDSYQEAAKMMQEVKSQVRKDIDFEMREKYNDAVKLEEARIDAAKAVGVAYGDGQQPSTTNLMWLK